MAGAALLAGMTGATEPDETGNRGIAGAVRRGTRVVLLAQMASQVISLVVLAIMMRLIAPAEYGLLGMVLPAVMLPRMAATLGLSTAVMQRDLSHAELSSLFWLSGVWGLLAAAVTAVCGPLLASAYERPILWPLCLALAGSTFIATLGSQHQALMERKLKLKPLAGARLLALVCGGFAGIYTARRGAGVWALVAQQYGELVVLTMWAWLLEPWRPGWPSRQTRVGGLIQFSGYYSASQLVYYLAQNLDKLLLPLLLGAAADRAVGLYSQAFNLMMKPVYLLTSPLSGIVVAGLSQASADPVAHEGLVARFYRIVAVGLFPCAAGVAIVGPDVMLLIGGQRWEAGGWILAVLAPAMLAHGLINLGMLMLASTGRAGRLLLSATALLGLLLFAGAIAIRFGSRFFAGQTGEPAAQSALGLASGYSAALVGVFLLPFLWLCVKSSGLRLATLLKTLWPSFWAAAVMAAAVWGLRLLLAAQPIPAWGRLAVVIAAGVAIYLALAWREIRWCWHELMINSDA